MIQTGHLWRLVVVAGVFMLMAGGLASRLVWLQAVQHEYYTRVAWTNQHRHIFREPRRGSIRDVKGNVLARSDPMVRVYADLRRIGPYAEQVARRVAPLLQWDEAALAQRLRLTVYTNSQGRLATNSSLNLRRKLRHEEWYAVTQAMGQITFLDPTRKPNREEAAALRDVRRYGIYAAETYHRVYPSAELAAHVIGFAQEEEQSFNGQSFFRIVGRNGVEAWFDHILSGAPGWRVTKRGLRQEVVPLREQDVAPRPGLDVVLTVDLHIQQVVEAALAQAVQRHSPSSAMAVVVRPRTGDILALASWPGYDPNRPGAVPTDHLRNRVISDVFEPGSTFKIVTVAAALNEQLVTLEDRINCEGGHFTYLGYTITDHESHGWLSVREILAKSSNVGAAKIGLMLGEARLERYVRRFGFGTGTGVPLPGEVAGIVHPAARWDRLTVTRVAFGYGVAATPLQVVMAMAALANRGELMRPRLVHRIQDPEGGLFVECPPQSLGQVVSSRTAQDMVAALKTVVAPGGTGYKAQLAYFTVAGKTGTAKKAGPGGYLPGRYFASFVGFFPADEPEVCIGVFLNEPHQGYYGGQTAAVIFKLIAEPLAQYLSIKPDRFDSGAGPVASTLGSAPRRSAEPQD